MQKSRLGLAVLCLLALLLSVAAVQAAPQGAKFAGTWTLTMAAGGPGGGGGGGGNGGGGNGGGGGGTQTLTIAKDGDKYKVTHTTGRGDSTADASVSSGTISWSEQRTGRDGNTMTIQYQATVDGDNMKGTMSGGQFNREFTAKRN
jgi:hypothetical protein